MASPVNPMIEILPERFPVQLALAYATPDNIVGRPIYRRAACFLHPHALPLLERAIALAAALGLRLKIFDAFRPAEAQWVLWNAAPGSPYVADPRRGSPHSRGVALDLTLVDGASGRELDMGTPFDSFEERAHHGYMPLPPSVLRHRSILLGIMSAAGWDFYSKEWWHYQMFDPRRYPVFSDSAAGTALMAPRTA